MKDLGWHTKPGVRILEGKWQDFVDSDDILGIGGFDVVYTDTFAEDYKCECLSDQATIVSAEISTYFSAARILWTPA